MTAPPSPTKAWKVHVPGEIAFKHGLVQPPTEYINGTVSKAWATRVDEPEEDDKKKGKAKVKKQPFTEKDAENRWERVKDVDESCNDVLEECIRDVASPEEWKHMLMVDNEKEVMMLPCIAFNGMPAKPKGTKIGQGMLLLGKVKDPEKGIQYRLHFVMKYSRASMEAEEIWGQKRTGCCCCISTSHQVQSGYQSKHAMDMVGSTLALDGNLFHVHYEAKDEATMISTFGGGSFGGKKGRGCCSRCCGGCRACCACICYFARCRCCRDCCRCCPKCCVNETTGGYWSSATSFEDTLDYHTTTIAQEIVKEVQMDFPNIAPVQHEMERSAVTKKLHTITMRYYCTVTDDVQTLEVVVKPDEKIGNIGKLTSWLSGKVIPVPEELKSKKTKTGSSAVASSSDGRVARLMGFLSQPRSIQKMFMK